MFSITLLLKRWRQSHHVNYPLLFLLLLMMFESVSNLLEWTGISTVIEPYKSFLLPMMWSFFLFSYLNRIQIINSKKTESELKKSELRYRTLLENLPLKVFLKDPQSVYISCNGNYACDLNTTPEQIIGKTDFDLLPDEQATKNQELDKRVVSLGVSEVNDELLNIRGKEIWIHSVEIPVYDDKCKITGILGIKSDITEQKKAEEAIRKSEERFHGFFNANTEYCFIITPEGIIRDVNLAVIQMSGYDYSELIGESISSIYAEESQKTIEQVKNEWLQNGIVRDKELIVKTKSGNKRIVSFSAIAEYNPGGTIHHLLLIQHDITELKKTENALRESNERLNLFVEHAPAAIAMFDADMRYIAVSNRWLSDSKIKNQTAGSYHYEVFPNVKESWKAAHQRGLQGIVTKKEEESYSRQDGTVQWTRWEVYPWYLTSGKVGGIAIFSEDITERKIAEIALEEEKERLAVTLRCIGDGVIATDINGKILTINKAGEELTGWKQKDAAGKPLEEVFYIVDADTGEKLGNLAKDITASKTVYKVPDNAILISFDKKELFIADSVAPILDTKGSVLGIVLVFRDVTERKKYEQSLKSSLHQKEILLQELYHRTKNNMQVISGLLDLQAISSGNESVERIIRDSKTRIRIMALAHEKLYKSKSLSQIDMKDYVNDLASLMMVSYSIKSDRVQLHCDIQDVKLLIDIAIPCGLLITELLSNSFKYAFPNNRTGRVDIRMHSNDLNNIELIVSDNGVGLPDGFDLTESPTLGVQLITQIVQHQLLGSYKINSDNGLRWIINFRTDIYSERI